MSIELYVLPCAQAAVCDGGYIDTNTRKNASPTQRAIARRHYAKERVPKTKMAAERGIRHRKGG